MHTHKQTHTCAHMHHHPPTHTHTLYLSVGTTEDGGALRASAPFLLFLPHKVLWGVVQLVVIAARIHGDGGVGGELGAWGEAEHRYRVAAHILLQHEAAKLYLLSTDSDRVNYEVYSQSA